MAVAENRAISGTVKGGPFRKGVSGNAGGRPRGLAQAVRDATGDGQELVAFMLTVVRGQHRHVRVRDRIDAATWLADRAFGKPIPHAGTGGGVRPDVGSGTDAHYLRQGTSRRCTTIDRLRSSGRAMRSHEPK